MKLYFADGTSIEVHALRGGSQHIQGVNRDVLTIEVSPEVASMDMLRQIFQDKEKTKELTTINFETFVDEETNETEVREIVNVVGQQYTMYLSIGNEMRQKSAENPGSMQAPQYEELNIVKIAQLTYTEHLLEQVLGNRIYSTS